MIINSYDYSAKLFKCYVVRLFIITNFYTYAEKYIFNQLKISPSY